MAVAELTFRKSLRDVESCLRTPGGKLYHPVIRGRNSRSMPAGANKMRDRRICADLPEAFIAQARTPHEGEPFGVELDETAQLWIALQSSCVFPCAGARYGD